MQNQFADYCVGQYCIDWPTLYADTALPLLPSACPPCKWSRGPVERGGWGRGGVEGGWDGKTCFSLLIQTNPGIK